jgi:sec-independent protein translocase protein TatA
MGLSLPHLIILALVILVLFGRGRISEMMGDFGKGIKSFKAGMTEETTDRPITPPPSQIAPPPPANHATLNGETVIDGAANKPQ